MGYALSDVESAAKDLGLTAFLDGIDPSGPSLYIVPDSTMYVDGIPTNYRFHVLIRVSNYKDTVSYQMVPKPGYAVHPHISKESFCYGGRENMSALLFGQIDPKNSIIELCMLASQHTPNGHYRTPKDGRGLVCKCEAISAGIDPAGYYTCESRCTAAKNPKNPHWFYANAGEDGEPVIGRSSTVKLVRCGNCDFETVSSGIFRDSVQGTFCIKCGIPSVDGKLIHPYSSDHLHDNGMAFPMTEYFRCADCGFIHNREAYDKDPVQSGCIYEQE